MQLEIEKLLSQGLIGGSALLRGRGRNSAQDAWEMGGVGVGGQLRNKCWEAVDQGSEKLLLGEESPSLGCVNDALQSMCWGECVPAWVSPPVLSFSELWVHSRCQK